MKTSRRVACTAAVSRWLGTLAGVEVRAQESEQRGLVHGFGTWAYGKTNGNLYLAGDRDGRYDDASFAINVRA